MHAWSLFELILSEAPIKQLRSSRYDFNSDVILRFLVLWHAILMGGVGMN